MRTFSTNDFDYDIIDLNESMCSITVEYYIKDTEFTKLFLNIDLPIDENNNIPKMEELDGIIRSHTPVGQMQRLYDRFQKAGLVDYSELATAIHKYKQKKKDELSFESNIVDENVQRANTASLQEAIMGNI